MKEFSRSRLTRGGTIDIDQLDSALSVRVCALSNRVLLKLLRIAWATLLNLQGVGASADRDGNELSSNFV